MNLYKSLYIFLYFPINMYFVCRYKHESTVPSTLILMFWFYLHIENEIKKNWFNFILLVFFQFLSVIRLICSCILLDNLQVSAVPASSRVGPGGQVLNVKHRMYKVWSPATNLLSPPPPPPPVPTSPPLNFDSVLSELKTVDVIWAGWWLHAYNENSAKFSQSRRRSLLVPSPG